MVDAYFEHILNDPDPYLSGLIAKATPKWEGVDADQFLNEIRGEGDEMNDHIMSLYPEWAFVIAPDEDVDFYALGAAERKKMLQGK